MKYYIINDKTDQQEGPFELDELAAAGVTPETYVWCKGMDDWQQAAEVPDICRHWRNRLFDIMHPATAPVPTANEKTPQPQSRGLQLGFSFRAGELPEIDSIKPDINRKPTNTLVPAIIMTLLCSPVTGAFAIYFSVMARSLWAGGKKMEAHEMSRRAKMWIGISFFLGVIIFGFTLFNRL